MKRSTFLWLVAPGPMLAARMLYGRENPALTAEQIAQLQADAAGQEADSAAEAEADAEGIDLTTDIPHPQQEPQP